MLTFLDPRHTRSSPELETIEFHFSLSSSKAAEWNLQDPKSTLCMFTFILGSSLPLDKLTLGNLVIICSREWHDLLPWLEKGKNSFAEHDVFRSFSTDYRKPNNDRISRIMCSISSRTDPDKCSGKLLVRLLFRLVFLTVSFFCPKYQASRFVPSNSPRVGFERLQFEEVHMEPRSPLV